MGLRGLLAAATLLTILAARPSFVAAQTTTAAPTERPVPVVTVPTRKLDDGRKLEAVGTGEALRSARVQPAVAGEVAEVSFRAGQRVRAGQPLLRLVDRRQRLDVEMSTARLERARALLARYDATAGTGAVPGAVIDDARSAVRTAEVELKLAQEALAERTVRAPFDGVIGLPQVDPGDRVTPETAIAVVDDRRSLWVAFDLPEADTSRVQAGHAVQATSPALPGVTIDGRLRDFDNRLDPATRSLRVRAELPNAQDRLRPGMSFTVRLQLPGSLQLAVPDVALQFGRDGSFVWVVREGRSQQVPVKLLQRREGVVLIDGPLTEADRVVTEGLQRLRPGRPVQPVEAGP
jgi:RND family efflux transporter MFP subunit